MATRVKSGFFTIFDHISLLKWEKNHKTKKLSNVDTYLECGLSLFIFSKERLQNYQEMTKNIPKKSSKKVIKVACTFSHTVRVPAGACAQTL